jgi:hypothetical protein
MKLGTRASLLDKNLKNARRLWHRVSRAAAEDLLRITSDHRLSIRSGELLLLNGAWYVTAAGLLRIARRGKCAGIHVRPVFHFCDPGSHRWAFEATVYKSARCRGFLG